MKTWTSRTPNRLWIMKFTQFKQESTKSKTQQEETVMTPINSTTNTDSSIQKAQDAVEVNLAKFESALAHLADRVEHTSHRVEHVGELARKSRDELMHLKDVATTAIDPFVPYFKQGKDISNKAIVGVKENPKPYLWAFAGLIGAFLA